MSTNRYSLNLRNSTSSKRQLRASKVLKSENKSSREITSARWKLSRGSVRRRKLLESLKSR